MTKRMSGGDILSLIRFPMPLSKMGKTMIWVVAPVEYQAHTIDN